MLKLILILIAALVLEAIGVVLLSQGLKQDDIEGQPIATKASCIVLPQGAAASASRQCRSRLWTAGIETSRPITVRA